MRTTPSNRAYGLLVGAALVWMPGCGGDDSQSTSHEKSIRSQPKLAVASISLDQPDEGNLPPSPELEKGSPEWLVGEIKSLLNKPPAESEEAEESLAPSEITTVGYERNESVVELATEAIAKSHADPEKEPVFNEAVRLLMEARIQLALSGNQAEITALYDDAASLYKRAPKSKAAAEAAFALARFAHISAQRFANDEPRWLEEFSRQARLFSENFPHEKDRAVSLLYSAGWTCELHSMMDEAIACYTLILERYPDSSQAQLAESVLRRLTLVGKPLQMAGPTLDGGYINSDQSRGKVLLVAFWATGTNSFGEELAHVREAERQFGPDRFAVLGVNLDEEVAAVESFVAEQSLAWPQIFYFEEQNRRWNHPIARLYGVRDIPDFWLVDPHGTVVDIQVEPANLMQQVGTLLDGGSANSAQ